MPNVLRRCLATTARVPIIHVADTALDTEDITSDDHPDSADWHVSEEGQEDRRLIATEDKTALHALVDWPKARGLLDGVPGVKASNLVRPHVDELEGTTQREARDAWGKREGIPWLVDLPESAD